VVFSVFPFRSPRLGPFWDHLCVTLMPWPVPKCAFIRPYRWCRDLQCRHLSGLILPFEIASAYRTLLLFSGKFFIETEPCLNELLEALAPSTVREGPSEEDFLGITLYEAIAVSPHHNLPRCS